MEESKNKMTRQQFLQIAIIAPIAAFFGIKALMKKKHTITMTCQYYEYKSTGEVIKDCREPSVYEIETELSGEEFKTILRYDH